MGRRVLAVVAVMGLVLASCGGAGPEIASGPSEAIQVHGDWTIDVFNTDGTLDQHHEFSNALTSTGEQLLAGLISRESAPGLWHIDLFGNLEEANPCLNQFDTPVACRITEVGGPGDPGFTSFDLVVELVPTSVARLSGSVTAGRDGTIGNVRSHLGECPPADSPATPCTTTGSSFTNTGAGNVAVAEGQIIQVTVDISFATG